MPSLKRLSWAQFDKLMNDLIDDIKSEKQGFDYVHGVPRGGLIPAVIISHRLQIPYLHDIEAVPSNSRVLVVDEIVETGATMLEVDRRNEMYERSHDIEYKYAAVFKRSTATFEPDFIAEVLDKKDWICFPYESEFSSVERPKSWK